MPWLSFVVPKGLKRIVKSSRVYEYLNNKKQYTLSNDYQIALERINTSNYMVDLGCGTSPHPKAKVAVDKYIEPLHRKFGSNKRIDIAEIEKRGIKFVEADFENLPFKDNEFDFAYSHHVVEHLDNPVYGLKEMMRVSQGGVVMCPGPMQEYVFGRKYHKWIVTSRKDTLIFIEKDWDGVLFGEGPYIENGKTKMPSDCNPFDILLNDGNWYKGIHRYKKLTKMLRGYWYGHYPCMETVFNWEGSFKYIVIWKDGTIEKSGN